MTETGQTPIELGIFTDEKCFLNTKFKTNLIKNRSRTKKQLNMSGRACVKTNYNFPTFENVSMRARKARFRRYTRTYLLHTHTYTHIPFPEPENPCLSFDIMDFLSLTRVIF